MVERLDEYTLYQFVSVRTSPKIKVRAEGVVAFLAKLLPRVSYLWSDNVKMYT